MGRIKSAIIKRTATKLLQENPELFSGDFERNKKLLHELIASKKIRNMVAGYITRIVKKQK
jgi:small subunit ribosomal protein S17e